MPSLDLEWVATFLAVAESGGFNPAARRLGLSQPAVHTQVKRQYDAPGATTYVRRGHNTEPTGTRQSLVCFAPKPPRPSTADPL